MKGQIIVPAAIVPVFHDDGRESLPCHSTAKPFGLEPPIAVPDANFQAFDLSGKLLGNIKGKVVYPPPFQFAS